jgi:molecular chaperone GrpE
VTDTAEPEQAADDEQLLRALADLDNLRKRFDREVARERSSQRARVTAEWLPVVDDLERVLEHAQADPSTLVEGVRAVYEQAISVLDRLGFPRFDAVGDHFDPQRHEAVSVADADAPAGTVVATVRPGYGTDEDVLRPAAVVVARPPG